jgi:hypothetical protein
MLAQFKSLFLRSHIRGVQFTGCEPNLGAPNPFVYPFARVHTWPYVAFGIILKPRTPTEIKKLNSMEWKFAQQDVISSRERGIRS